MSFFVAPVFLYGELAFSIAAFSGKLPKYTAAVPHLRSVHPSTTRESKWRYIMKKVNLRDLYPDVYKTDHFVEVTEDVLETIRDSERAEAAYDRRMYRYKAHYSLDCDNGIENAILMKPQTPEMLLEEKQLREQLYAAVMALPEKQAKRIYARYYLGMRVSEIAASEDVDPSRVRDSIRRGLKQLGKYF
jgi:RNA polymerase sigma-70 factor (ECF subfamily)